LSDLDPIGEARRDGGSLAAASVVLVDSAGAKYVRTPWFFEHVRHSGALPISRQAVTARMALVGWNHIGKIHARQPKDQGRGQLLLPFFMVPPGWEEADVE
jgi:hypothetical protein